MVILSSESWEIICNLHIVYNDTKVLMLNSLWSLDVNTSSTIYVCLYVVGEFVTLQHLCLWRLFCLKFSDYNSSYVVTDS